MREAVALPSHVAIIPDGNRRWASEKGNGAIEGHAKGAEVTRTIATYAADQGVRYLSIWGMSIDNLQKRSPQEIAGLLAIFRREFKSLATHEDIHTRQVKIHVLGEWEKRFPSPVRHAIREAMASTASYTSHHLVFFLAYNGTQEMVEAVQAIVRQAEHTITPAVIKNNLYTKDLPPVDFLIRTGGDPHLSAGFMMWDMAEAELYFTEKLWPEFTAFDFQVALDDYSRRRRRKGA
ncbi:MAG: polyprenyl diphosphate synthase [Acidobacteriota bacterium]